MLRISYRKVDRVKLRFVEEGLAAALGGRQGRREHYERKADGEFEAHVVALSCSEPPPGYSQWSLRLLADQMVELDYVDSVSYETVRRVLKKRHPAGASHRVGDSAPAANADFVAAMEAVLDVYQRPYDESFPVLDETPRQLIGEVRSPMSASPGRPAREDYEYRRLGSCNVFMATEPLAGTRMTKVTARRTRADGAQFVSDIAERYPRAEKITLVMDNLNTHRLSSLEHAFSAEEAKALAERFELVYTPKHGSWLNVAEIELSVMTRQCLRRRIDNMESLRAEVAAWQAARGSGSGEVCGELAVHQGRCAEQAETTVSVIRGMT